jgi:iron complex outermembrane receptor protein
MPSPANYTTAANRTAANPYYASGCLAPYSIQGARSTCILNNQEYGMALYANEQITFYARGTKQFSPDHKLTVDYMRGQEYIIATRNPTQSVAVNGVAATLPSSSKWYPGGAGGVPAMPGLTGQPLFVTWSVADLGLAATKDVQVNQRLAASDEGRIGNWDYKAGLVYGVSTRKNYYKEGYVTGAGLNAGLANGSLNPFGLQDAAGLAYLESISVDGAMNRIRRAPSPASTRRLSRSLMELGGGSLALAVGADLHRDTTEDEKLPIVNTRHLRQRGRRHAARARATSRRCTPNSTSRSRNPDLQPRRARRLFLGLRQYLQSESQLPLRADEEPDVPRFGQYRLPRADPVRPLRLPHRRRQRHHRRPLGRSGAVPGRHAGRGRFRHGGARPRRLGSV